MKLCGSNGGRHPMVRTEKKTQRVSLYYTAFGSCLICPCLSAVSTTRLSALVVKIWMETLPVTSYHTTPHTTIQTLSFLIVSIHCLCVKQSVEWWIDGRKPKPTDQRTNFFSFSHFPHALFSCRHQMEIV